MYNEDLISIRANNLFLSSKSNNYTELSRDLCGLQAQFFNNVLYSILIRCNNSHENWDNHLIKTWTLRGTLHAIPFEDLPLYLALYPDRSYFNRYNFNSEFMHNTTEKILIHIKNGNTSRTELKEIFKNEPEYKDHLDMLFSGWGGILKCLAEKGDIVFNKVSDSKFRAISIDEALPQRQEALLELLKRYFKSYGPATVNDASYFFGLTMKELNEIIEKIDGLSFAMLNNKKHYYFEKASIPQKIEEPIFLTGFDPILLGYKDKSFIIDEEDIRKIITLTGIIKPAILFKGKIIATWGIKNSAMIIYPFKSLSKKLKNEIAKAGMIHFKNVINKIEFSL